MNGQTVKKLEVDESESNSKHRNSMDMNDSLGWSGIESNKDENETTKSKNAANAEQVFGIPSIVEQIIQEVQNLKDLKQFRLVNSTWMETATKLMFKTNSALVALSLDFRTMKYKKFNHWRLNHYYDPYTRSIFQEDEKDVEDADDWTTLKEIIDKSTLFPCSTFSIHKGNLSHLVMGDFKIVGDSIKELKLIAVSGMSVEFGVLSGLNCPNLESLYMDIDQIEWSPEDISFELPKLKLLDIKNISPSRRSGDSPFKILATLIAPNLQVIRGFDLSRDFEAISKAGKIHCIKELNFGYCFGYGELYKLITKLEIFVDTAPKLETLNLRLQSSDRMDFREESRWRSCIQKLLDLSKNTLKCFDGIEFLRDNISPNLQVIKGFDFSRDTQRVLRAGKIHCVKELCFGLGGLELENLRLFLRPQLETLEIFPSHSLDLIDSDFKREFSGLLEQLLELNKDTLRSFKFDGVGVFFEDMKFPIFSKLQHLKVTGDRVGIFPSGINLTETFPALEILDLDKCIFFDENWDKFFPHVFIGNLTTVRTLICCHWFTDATKRNLRILCPNAKVVWFK